MRPRLLALAALAVALFGGATAVVLWEATTTAQGRILLELSATHGVHTHDVEVALAAYAVATLALLLAATVTLTPTRRS